MVVEADTLTPSTDNTQNQARDRNRTTSRLQVDTIANNLDPAQLTDSTTMTHGSPTITDDGTIIAGNGRTMALKQAYAQGRGEEYRQMLATKADEYGLDKTLLAQMNNPVLVKSVGNIPPDKLRQLALNSNETGTMAQSTFENARADVERVAKVNLDNLHSDDTGNINTPSNKPIINQFVSQFPIEQQNALRQADGTLSKQGLERFENALLLSAYGYNPTTQAILESTDLELKNAIKALVSTVPSIVKTKQGIQDGITPNDDIARDITEALSVLAKLRRDNVRPYDYLAQTTLFEDELSDVGKRLLDFMDKNIRSVVKIRQLLYKYYANLSKENLNQNDMFGKPTQSKQTRLNHALQELGYEQFNEQNTTANQSNAEQSSPSASPNQSDTTQPTDQTRPTSQTGGVNERPQKGKSDEQSVGRDDGGVKQTPKNLKEGLQGLKAKAGKNKDLAPKDSTFADKFASAINEDAIAKIANSNDDEYTEVKAILDKLDRHQNGKPTQSKEKPPKPQSQKAEQQRNSQDDLADTVEQEKQEAKNSLLDGWDSDNILKNRHAITTVLDNVNNPSFLGINSLDGISKEQLKTAISNLKNWLNESQEQENAKQPTTVQPPSRVLVDTPSDSVGRDANERETTSVHSKTGGASERRDAHQSTNGDDDKRSTGYSLMEIKQAYPEE